jgi:hypothetical protein
MDAVGSRSTISAFFLPVQHRKGIASIAVITIFFMLLSFIRKPGLTVLQIHGIIEVMLSPLFRDLA